VGCGESAPRSVSTAPVGFVQNGIVPWINQPAPAYEAPAPKAVPYPTQAAPCTASQLEVSTGRHGAAAGTLLEGFKFTNIGTAACLLRGFPTISGVRAGTRVLLHPTRARAGAIEPLVPSDMAARGHVFLDVTTGAGCQGGAAPQVVYRSLLFGLPAGGTVRGRGLTILEQCGLVISRFGLPPRVPEPVAAPGSPGVPHATSSLPSSARPGTRLRYVITLSNPTEAAVSFDHCPSYTEGLYTATAVSKRSYFLNCQAVSSVPAHRRARFAMELPVPQEARAGIAKLGWSLNTPTGPSVVGVIDIG